ncbi:MAG: hypothetical protein AB7G06_07690 [Bdellovibrionales bacterium]
MEKITQSPPGRAFDKLSIRQKALCISLTWGTVWGSSKVVAGFIALAAGTPLIAKAAFVYAGYTFVAAAVQVPFLHPWVDDKGDKLGRWIAKTPPGRYAKRRARISKILVKKALRRRRSARSVRKSIPRANP